MPRQISQTSVTAIVSKYFEESEGHVHCECNIDEQVTSTPRNHEHCDWWENDGHLGTYSRISTTRHRIPAVDTRRDAGARHSPERSSRLITLVTHQDEQYIRPLYHCALTMLTMIVNVNRTDGRATSQQWSSPLKELH